MARGHAPLTHDTLDDAAGDLRGKAAGIEHLRRLLVAAGVLPARDEYLTRLERDIEARLAAVHETDRAVLRRFVSWYTMPRVRRRIASGRDSRTTCYLARCSLTGPSRLLRHLRRNGVPLAALRQADLEQWTADNPGYVTDAVLFLRWAHRQRLAPGLDLPRQRMQTPREFTDAQHQWAIARRCLTDESLTHRARLVGALVLLYGQTSTAIARLRRCDITSIDSITHIRLGADAVALDNTLGTIARELATADAPDARPRGLARAFNPDGDGWLFPGRGPGKPLGEAALRMELRKLGISTRAGRNTALLTLARNVPPMLMKDLLGIGASTAERWREHAGGQWAAYAADDPPHATGEPPGV
ncbi:hypothetical protein [Intrasporangium calvum]|uniref:hypothetical protein n=1 Tax=Intrasporangium calvum TaxID=53358 RepID=UPI00123721E8|nr:hypothetical protein [Intrasporangium calvum]